MTDDKNESSYKKLLTRYETVEKNNLDLTAKVNSLLDALEKEKADKSRFELVAKINSINKEFKPTDEMDDSFLKGILHAWSNLPKKNAAKPNENGGTTPPPIKTTEGPLLDGKPIPDDMKQFIGIRKDLEEHKAASSDGVM